MEDVDPKFIEALSTIDIDECFRGIKGVMSKSYPDASMMFVAINPNTDDAYRVYADIAGNIDMASAALCQGMKNSRLICDVVMKAIRLICRTAGAERAEQCISSLEGTIANLKKMNDLPTRISLLKAEAKRQRKLGNTTFAASKEAEIQRLLSEDAKKKSIARTRLENLSKARKALADKREKEKIKKHQPQRPQFNPHAAAKRKLQQIAERQAERKKKKSTESERSIHSC